jgi:hypothetical protein
MKAYPKVVVAMIGFLLMPLLALAQSEQALLAQILEEEQKTIEALALYPSNTRIAILEASKFPESLIKLETMQGKTSKEFKALLEKYPQSVQSSIWDLTRYPGLVEAIVEGGQKQGIDFEIAVQDFHKEIVPRARQLSDDYFPVLVEVHRLNRYWDAVFGELVSQYPAATRDALRQLVDLPEVLSLLTDNIRLTVLVGDLYHKNPTWLVAQMDSLSIVVAEARAKELEEWRHNLANNPQAEEELQAAAQAYADEYGYDDDYYDYDDDLYYDEDDRYGRPIEYNYYYYNYPYWFGYPHWYPYARWRPYPYWYDWGFYWGHNHVIVIVDMPSFWFVDWHFYHPWNHYYYPHLSSCYVNHYYGHRGSSGSISSNVRNWHGRNRDIVTDDWLDRARTDSRQFVEYGKLETERERYNRTHVDKPVSQKDYLDKNRKQYPTLAGSVERKREQERTAPPVVKQPTEPRREPAKPDVKQPRIEPKKQPTVTPRKEAAKERPKYDLPKMQKAEKQHRDVWEKTKRENPTRPSVERPKAAPPKLQKQPSTAPKAERKTRQKS